MKKIFGIMVLLAGCIGIIYSVYMKYMEGRVQSVIGGADGPTAIFVAGRITPGIPIWMMAAVGVLLIFMGILFTRK